MDTTHENLRERNIFEGCTKTSTVNQFYEWLCDTSNIDVVSRPFKGISDRKAVTRYASENISWPQAIPDSAYKYLVHLGSYNYPGLNIHPKVIQAAQEALLNYGVSTSGVRILNGTTELHIAFEKRLAHFLGVEDVVTYSSGYAANFSVFPALCDEKDVVFSDSLNHQSILDGLKLSGAHVIKFPHLDYVALRGALEGVSKLQRKFIVTDGVFSMDGDVADLPQIVRLANEFNAFIVVDDAHATGGYGPYGKGTPAHFGLEKEIDVLTGSLSKGLPGIGGFAAGSKQVTNLMRYGSNGYIFSASLPPSVVGGLMASLDILETEPQIQDTLHQNAKFLREGLKKIGLDIMQSSSYIIPLLLPTREIAGKFSRLLHEKGVYVNPITFPAVPRHLPRLRLTATTLLTPEDIDFSLQAIKETAQELSLI